MLALFIVSSWTMMGSSSHQQYQISAPFILCNAERLIVNWNATNLSPSSSRVAPHCLCFYYYYFFETSSCCIFLFPKWIRFIIVRWSAFHSAFVATTNAELHIRAPRAAPLSPTTVFIEWKQFQFFFRFWYDFFSFYFESKKYPSFRFFLVLFEWCK